ncbi:MAG: hypothetical protein BGO10_09650 [Chlamydia sp. 32-24]|nr:MAG: hypothetical protein BGO10_09650 [Chlamydia sp. 32-24]
MGVTLKSFADEYTFKEIKFEAVVTNYFKNQKVDLINKTIFISGFICSDGKGDFAHIKTYVKRIHKLLPLAPIEVFLVAQKKHKELLAPINHCNLQIEYSDGDMFVAENYLSDRKEQLQVKAAKAIRISGPVGIIQVSPITLCQPFFSSLNDCSIQEYDEKSNIEPAEVLLRLGLNEDGVGLFTKKIKPYTWNEVEHQSLKDVLFKSIEDYQSSHSLFFNYKSDLRRFVVHALDFNFYHQQLVVDILNFESINLTDLPLKELKRKKFNLKSVSIISFNNGIKVEAIHILRKKGKKHLRIINVANLTHQDFKKVAYLSSPLMGCTGDSSFCMALSYGKIIHYQLPVHKQRLYFNLLNIIKNTFGEDAILAKYMLGVKAKEANSYDLKDPAIVFQAKELSKVVSTSHSCNQIFDATIKRVVRKHADISYREKERNLKQQFLEGKITEDELLTHYPCQ